MAVAEPPKRIYISHALSGAGVLASVLGTLDRSGYVPMEDSASLAAGLDAMMRESDGAVVIVTPGSLRSAATNRELTALLSSKGTGYPIVTLLDEDVTDEALRDHALQWRDRTTILRHGELDAMVAVFDQAFGRAGPARPVDYVELRVITPDLPVSAIAFGEVDGRPVVLMGTDRGIIHALDIHSHTTRELGNQGSPVTTIAVGPDGVIISGSLDNVVRRWRNGTAEPLAEYPDTVMALSATGERGAHVSLDGGFVRGWSDAGDPSAETTSTLLVGDIGTMAALPGLVATSTELGGVFLSGGRELPAFGVAVSALAIADDPLSVVVAYEDGDVYLWQPDQDQYIKLDKHHEPARVAIGSLNGERIVITEVGGVIRIWGQARSGHVEWVGDAPADDDWLRRRPLAKVIAERLKRVDAQEPGSSLMIHIDAPWGTGKSTLLNFLRAESTPDFTVVDFDAWQEAGVGPAWWAVLTSLRTAIRRQRRLPGRIWLRINESLARLRRVGAPFVLAVTGVMVFIGVILLVLNGFHGMADAVKTVIGGLAGVSTLFAGALVASRFLLWDSARGARLFEQSNTNPMLEVERHFTWLMSRSKRPVVFLVDDLDRCKETYIVELLDKIQNLIRDIGPPNIHFVVCADGAWLRTAYEHGYATFASAAARPGEPMGYKFLEKFFQLHIPIPAIDTARRETYLRRLLHSSTAPTDVVVTEEARVRARLDRSVTEAQVVDALRTASPAVRDLVAEQALARMTTKTAIAETEHSLLRFADLLPPNPRAMKRFVNSYSALRAVRTLEGNAVAVEALALWTILEIRWPGLADHLRDHPEAIAGAEEDLPERLRPLHTDPILRTMTTSTRYPSLTPALIRACCGR
ncbi:P-loop NTPase fold protein [Actinokineospora enzanensis]|uniref:P-loop NTPase fold protein n=1 Tax=Actinokineospora enzanensis TaxID=155975 RepID=UPI000360DA2F|nr:P-loop NTPase fold protein [Actinokineospora enzanensis]